ncbi:methyltransferase domain-containing protein [bacterium]|nr:methyltransferase domain-containing protein [bacterium]
MKYFKHLFDSAADALVDVFFNDRHADKVIEFYFKNHKKWGKRDRHFFAENVYGAVRWWNQFIYLTNAENLPPTEQAHRAIAAHLLLQDQPLPDWYQSFFSLKVYQEKKEKLTTPHLVHAVPEWLDNLATKELGSVWPKTIQELNKTAKVVLRCNTEKITRKELQQQLNAEGIQTRLPSEDLFPHALELVERANVFRTKAFEQGLFEVQDASSQRVALLLNPQPGERIIDACAGAGGKSLHIAALMQNKGKIISLDIFEKKLLELKKRARRAGTSLIETRVIENTKTIKRLEKSADALLLDVPCSGLGVLKRNPDSKWKLTKEKIENLHETQKSILENYTKMVKPGGRCVYATCSVLPSENQQQVDAFLENNKDWKKIKEEIILPQDHDYDGFYMAEVRRSF